MHRTITGSLVLGALAVGLGPACLAAAASAHSPIQVEVTGGTSAPMEGQNLSYAVRVHDTDAVAYPHAVVWQLFPAGFKVVGSSPRATLSPAGPEWDVDLSADGSAQLTDTVLAGSAAQVKQGQFIVVRQPGDAAAGQTGGRTGGQTGGQTGGRTPSAQPFSTTVCVRESAQGPILACASADQTLALRPAEAGAGGIGGLGQKAGLLAAAGGCAAAGLAALVVWRRRRSA